ncbi:GyrI-like domain-containing protein [Streptococcus dentiloxodontae]
MKAKTFVIFHEMRTNNFSDPDSLAKFTCLWEASAELLTLEQPVYGIYHDYQSDYKGDYSVSTALEGTKEDGRFLIEPVQAYQIFSTSKEDVAKTWQDIWTLEESGELNRTYQLDYEKYYPDGKTEIYIGIKEGEDK